MSRGAIDKSELRRRMRQARDMVGDHLLRSVELWAAVAELPSYQAAGAVMAFVGAKGEPDTDPLFARLTRDGKRLLLPRVEGGRLVVGDGAAPRTISQFGISEPTGPALPLSVVEFVIVPGLAFTPVGDRLGYGAGFYDVFLASLPPGVPNAGGCFAEQLVDSMPTEPHDVRVQQVVSA
jgi:5-formyltetrahydrofolate cyclo-ligase